MSVTPKQKFKISQLAAKPITVELVHPVAGETGIFLSVCGPHSPKLRAAFAEYNSKETKSDKDHTDLIAGMVMDWDVEAFELPYSDENAKIVFAQVENSWIVEQLAPMVRDYTLFFRPEGEPAA